MTADIWKGRGSRLEILRTSEAGGLVSGKEIRSWRAGGVGNGVEALEVFGGGWETRGEKGSHRPERGGNVLRTISAGTNFRNLAGGQGPEGGVLLRRVQRLPPHPRGLSGPFESGVRRRSDATENVRYFIIVFLPQPFVRDVDALLHAVLTRLRDARSVRFNGRLIILS